MAVYKNHAGFQISPAKIQIVEINYKENHFVLENVDESFFPDSFSFKEEESILINILQDSFNDLNTRRVLNSELVSFTLPANEFRIFDIPYDEHLTNKDLIEHIKWELSILQPDADINDLAIQSVKLGKSGLRDTSNLIILTMPQKPIKLLGKFCSQNGLKLRYIDNEHLSANNLLYFQKHINENKKYLTILIRDNYLSVVLLEKNVPVYMSWAAINSPDNIPSVLISELEKITKRFEEVIDLDKSYIFGDFIEESLFKKISDATGLGPVPVNPFGSISKSDYARNNIKNIRFVASYSAAAGIAFRLT